MSCSDDGKLDIDDLTGGDLYGNGDFDELMRAVKAHVEEQYDLDRITGSNYAEVYLGALTEVLKTSSVYALAAPKATQEILLMKQSILTEIEKTKLINAQVANTNADTNVKVKQLDVMDKEMEHVDAQILLTNANVAQTEEQTKLTTCNIEKTGAETLQVYEQTKLIAKNVVKADSEILNIEADTRLKDKQHEKIDADVRLTEKQIIKIDSDIELTDEQINKIKEDTKYVTQNILKNIEDTELVTCQQDNTRAQTGLTEAKTDESVCNLAVMQEQIDLSQCNQALTGAKTQESIKNLDMIDAQIVLTQHQGEKMAEETRYVSQNVLKNVQETKLITCQQSNTTAQTNLTNAKVTETMCSLGLIDANKHKVTAEKDLILAKKAESGKQLLVMDAQIDLTKSQVELNDETILKMKQEVKLMAQKVINANSENLLLQAQRTQVLCQAHLTCQKIHTEEAQVKTRFPGSDMCLKGTEPKGLNGHSPGRWEMGGIMGAQYALLQKQKESFDRDAAIKMAKIMGDTAAIEANVMNTRDAFSNSGFSHTERKATMTMARNAIYHWYG